MCVCVVLVYLVDVHVVGALVGADEEVGGGGGYRAAGGAVHVGGVHTHAADRRR